MEYLLALFAQLHVNQVLPFIQEVGWLRIAMASILLPIAFVVVGLITWTLYLAIMHVGEVKAAGRLPKGTLPFAYTILAVGYLIDFVFNLMATIPFLELPREWLFSGRVSRHVGQATWRGAMSRWFCATLLDPFDPSGCHCRE